LHDALPISARPGPALIRKPVYPPPYRSIPLFSSPILSDPIGRGQWVEPGLAEGRGQRGGTGDAGCHSTAGWHWRRVLIWVPLALPVPIDAERWQSQWHPNGGDPG